MNKETYEALKVIMRLAFKGGKFYPNKIVGKDTKEEKAYKQVKSWINEVAKEYDDDKQDICEGCGELLLDGQSIILGEKRHSACS